MNRIVAFAAAAVALAPAAGLAQDFEPAMLRFAHSVGTTAPSAPANSWFAEQVAERSGGNVKIEYFWGGSAGAPAEMFDLVSTGALDAAAITPSWYAANLPFLASLSSVPMSYADTPSVISVADALYADVPALQAEAEKANLHILRFAAMNDYHLLCTTPVNSVDDFRGKKIRSQGDFMPVLLNALGATPVTVLPGEFYEALQRKTIDCIALPWDFLVSNRLYEVAKYASEISFGPLVAHVDAVNLGKWNSLPVATQELLTTVAEEARAVDRDALAESEQTARQTLLDNGVEIAPFPDQDKLVSVVPDLLDLWASRMGSNEAAAQEMVAEWKQVR